MKTIKLKWTGIRPLVMHNGMLADPLYSYTKEMKELCKKPGKKRTDADWDRLYRTEWEGGLYWSEKEGPIIPSDNIERTIQLGAQKSRIGKDVQAAVFCSETEVRLEYDGPRDKVKLYASGRFTLRKGAIVGQARIIRTRPMFPTGWSITFTLEYDETVITNEDALLKACQDAGALIGLGDHRPKFGRFVCERL